jgi:hypothetical protein
MNILNASTNGLFLTDVASGGVFIVPASSQVVLDVTNVLQAPDGAMISGRSALSWNGTSSVVLVQPTVGAGFAQSFESGLEYGSGLAAILLGYIAVRRALSLGDAWND